MRILSNYFPTNLPDSEMVSQGGPANFAKLFTDYIVSNTKHSLICLFFENIKSGPVKYQKIYSFQQRDYYRLRVLRESIKNIVSADKDCDPEVILKAPIKQIVKLIHDQKPDVIFLNGFGIFNWMLLKAGEMTKIPVVIQHAGIWTKELAVHKDLYTIKGRKIMEQMEKDSTRIASREIFLNEWSKKYYDQKIAKNTKKTHVIPLPFDFVSFKKMNSNISAELFNFDKKLIHIGIIARWDKIKNHQAILAMAKYAKTKKLPWVFHAITTIPEIDRFKKEKKRYEKYVDVIPSLDREGVSQFCDAVDLLVLPSIFDVSPTVVLEAIALNTPIVISTNIGFAHEFKIHGGKDWVVDFSNITTAVKCIKKLIDKKMPRSLINEIKLVHKDSRVFEEYFKILKV